MTTARLAPILYDDDRIIPVSASGLSTANKGDWAIASAQWAIAADDATIGSPAYKVSALGVFLENNPTFDDQGVGINNTGITVLRRGVLRVSAGQSATARTIPLGSHCYPDTTGSGMIGVTGATGIAAVWDTAPPQGISANPTGAIASGVAQVIDHPVGGIGSAGQIDIAFNLATNVGYF